ncbi:unnamed protein product [Bathycoccus prasinos]|jgi:hypothetical protein
MVNSGRVYRVGDLRDIFKKEEEEMVVTKTTFLDDDDEKSEEEEIIETEKQEDGEEEEEKGGDDGDDEEEDKEENVYEVSVRVLGTLESFDASNSVGVLKDDAFALTFDASSMSPTFKWKLKSLYFLIGEYEKCSFSSPSSSTSTRFSILRNGVLRVRIAQNASGLDVNAYHEAAKIREEFLH